MTFSLFYQVLEKTITVGDLRNEDTQGEVPTRCQSRSSMIPLLQYQVGLGTRNHRFNDFIQAIPGLAM